MYLRRLEIHGFKSFASRIVLDFGAGATAVVGPNGCGKSNVADALRWVLGQQSGKLLRASKLEDVIFAGSSRRPSATAAEVSLTLDNTGGWLPIDAPEVIITRKVNRSGESSYFLNRQRSRLRDISSLLLKARAGQSSYAVMGQGLVESVLNFRPEERRLLLEDAADVQVHRAKIEEALQKLAATRENVERVGLLLQEMAPHITQLERQARRAARRAEMAKQLKRYLRIWYGNSWTAANAALEESKGRLSEATQRCQALQDELSEQEKRLETIYQSLEEHRAHSASGANRLALVRDGRSRLQHQVNLDRQRLTLLLNRKKEIEDELGAVAAEREQLTMKAGEGEKSEGALAQEVSALKESLSQLETEQAPFNEEVAEIRSHSESLAAEAMEAKASAAAARSRLQGWLEAQNHASGPEPGVAQLNAASAKLRELAVRYAELRRQDQELSERAHSLGQALQQEEERLQADRQALDERQGQLSHLEAEIARLDARQEALAETGEAPLLAAPDNYEQALPVPVPENGLTPITQPNRLSFWSRLFSYLLAPFRRSQADETAPLPAMPAMPVLPAPSSPLPPDLFSRVLGTVAQLIRVPIGLEKAISAALGDKAGALVVANRQDALAAAQIIVEQGGPHTVILPLNDVQTIYPPQLLRERGIIGIASNLVRCQDRLRPLVNSLLGRTIVVEDLAVAHTVLKRGIGAVVTKNGVLLHPSGVITSGFGLVIRRHHDLRSLPRQIHRLTGEREQLADEVQALRERLTSASGEVGGMRREHGSLSLQRETLQEALLSIRQQLGRRQGEMRGLLAKREDRTSKRASALERALLESEHERLAAEAEVAQAAALQERAALTAALQSRDIFQRKLSQSHQKLAALEAQLQSIRHLGQRDQESLDRLEVRGRQRWSQLNDASDETASIERRLEGRTEALSRLSLWLAKNETAPQHGLLPDLERQLRTLETEIAATRRDLLDAERLRLEREARVEHERDEVAALQRRMDEDGFAISEEGMVFVPADGEGPIPSWLSAGEIASAEPIDIAALEDDIARLRSQLRNVGDVHPEAEHDYHELKGRHDFLISQMADLQGAERSLRDAIQEMEEAISQGFAAVFHQVGTEFQRYFVTFFGGGYAKLILTPPEDYKTSGVDIIAQPPGKRLQGLNMLSGGEKALTAIAFLFALLQTNPSPFCLLDEVDASLDEANVGRFTSALRELSQRTQFIFISHNRRTIEAADRIYGVAMGPDNASKVLSLQLSDLPVA